MTNKELELKAELAMQSLKNLKGEVNSDISNLSSNIRRNSRSYDVSDIDKLFDEIQSKY